RLCLTRGRSVDLRRIAGCLYGSDPGARPLLDALGASFLARSGPRSSLDPAWLVDRPDRGGRCGSHRARCLALAYPAAAGAEPPDLFRPAPQTHLGAGAAISAAVVLLPAAGAAAGRRPAGGDRS